MLEYYDTLIKLVIALILGGIIGWERETHGQIAGFRTHIVLCLGATLIMLVSIHIRSLFSTDIQADPRRIAAQVVSGIGFLGAAAILRFGFSVRGVTTATSLWSVSGVGLAVGSGFYGGAVIATTLIVLSLSLFDRLEKALFIKKYIRSLVK